MSLKQFEREMKAAIRKIEKASEKTIRAVGVEFFSRIVQRTPVGNPSLWESKPPEGYTGGALRANWQASINRPESGTINKVDPSGSSAISGITGMMGKYQLGETAYLTNNLPYAYTIEMGNHSKQAPVGMVRVTEKDFKPLLEAIARKNKI